MAAWLSCNSLMTAAVSCSSWAMAETMTGIWPWTCFAAPTAPAAMTDPWILTWLVMSLPMLVAASAMSGVWCWMALTATEAATGAWTWTLLAMSFAKLTASWPMPAAWLMRAGPWMAAAWWAASLMPARAARKLIILMRDGLWDLREGIPLALGYRGRDWMLLWWWKGAKKMDSVEA